MRTDSDLGSVALAQQLQRRERRPDARVVCDATVLERDVQVGADEHAAAVDLRDADGARVPHSSIGIELFSSRRFPAGSRTYATLIPQSPLLTGFGRPRRAAVASTSSTWMTQTAASPACLRSTVVLCASRVKTASVAEPVSKSAYGPVSSPYVHPSRRVSR